MSILDRQQKIIGILEKQPSISVSELVRIMSVSEATIRSDLKHLEKANLISRVWGGAVLREDYHFISPAFKDRYLLNAEAKKRIAHRAATLVEDGDSILLDSSTAVFHMAPYIKNVQNLTITTNGIEVAVYLTKNTSHTVILISGVLRPDYYYLSGPLGEKTVKELNFKTAFISCTGFSIEKGLTDSDIQEIQLKKEMISSTERVVALIDSSKFDKVGLYTITGLDKIQQIYTDDRVDLNIVKEACQAGVLVYVCGDKTVSTYSTVREDNTPYKIGFANLSEDIPFSIDVRRGLEQAAQRLGNVHLIMADNQLKGEVALKVADDLISETVDLAIEYQIDQKIGNIIMAKFKRANIPVIAVDIPMVGATFFGVDNYRSGHLAGVALGGWIAEKWGSEIDQLIVMEEPLAGELPAARIQGQLEGLQEVIGVIPKEKITRLDSGNTSEESENQMAKALKQLKKQHKIAVICFNDDAAIGSLIAARKLVRDNDVVIVGQGADRRVRTELHKSDCRIIGSTAFWPEKYGEKLLDVALRIIKGEPVHPAVYIDHVFIDSKNIDQYYPEGYKP